MNLGHAVLLCFWTRPARTVPRRGFFTFTVLRQLVVALRCLAIQDGTKSKQDCIHSPVSDSRLKVLFLSRTACSNSRALVAEMQEKGASVSPASIEIFALALPVSPLADAFFWQPALAFGRATKDLGCSLFLLAQTQFLQATLCACCFGTLALNCQLL